jgi:hypothetical protein
VEQAKRAEARRERRMRLDFTADHILCQNETFRHGGGWRTGAEPAERAADVGQKTKERCGSRGPRAIAMRAGSDLPEAAGLE